MFERIRGWFKGLDLWHGGCKEALQCEKDLKVKTCLELSDLQAEHIASLRSTHSKYLDKLRKQLSEEKRQNRRLRNQLKEGK